MQITAPKWLLSREHKNEENEKSDKMFGMLSRWNKTFSFWDQKLQKRLINCDKIFWIRYRLVSDYHNRKMDGWLVKWFIFRRRVRGKKSNCSFRRKHNAPIRKNILDRSANLVQMIIKSEKSISLLHGLVGLNKIFVF